MTITGERFDAARPKTPTEYLKNKFGAANMPERLLELMKLLNTEDEEDSYKKKKNQKEEDLAGLKAAKVIRKEMKSIIYDFPEFRGFDKSTLRLPQLNQYLFSTKFNPPIPNKVRDDMMNAPLSHYFIHTSLNSYFTGNLVLEKYSDEPIIDALKQGVRVIELDLMPCPEGGICVSRRMNFEKPLKLQKCLDSIKDHAFTHTSSYPVIITFKDGANPDLHSKACQMINQTFGGMVHQRDPHSLEEFPSPAQLRNKILISRRPPKQLLCANGAKEKICVQDGKKTLQDSPDVNYQSLVSFYAVEPSGMLRKALTDKVKKTQRPGWYEKEVISFTKTSFLRIRPSGKLYKSAPYKPQRAWIHGAQMIALSRQEDNKKLWLVQGMFRANGGCGYVKKPDFLLNASPSGVFYPAVDPMGKRKMLTVKVYMGDGWRVDFENTIGRWSKPKLYVMIGIAGVTHDEKIVQTKVQRKWIPVWGQDFTFPLRYHHLALLSIQVYNHDLSLPDGFCGQTCLPVPELIEGIRAVPLYDEKGKKCSSTMLLMGFTWS